MNYKILLTAWAIITFTGSMPAQSKQQDPTDVKLPERYFRLLTANIARVEKRLMDEPRATLASIESEPGWKHFPNAILMPAVLYTKSHPANKQYGDPALLKLAMRIGDLLVTEYNNGTYTSRGDNDWDTYMWMEAYRLLLDKLGEERRGRWKAVILQELSLLEPRLALCQDYARYNAPFITTSPNHYAIYASTLLVGGHIFNKQAWIKLATKVLHRFCVEEQTPDGYWGEHSQAGPTTGYDYLTVTQVALYWEYSKDPEAIRSLRRTTDFHKYFTYPDGTPVETINDRNRHWGVSMWGQFGFSHFPDGRRYAAFLASFSPYAGDMQSMGRIAQDLLYFHEGNSAAIPQDQENYSKELSVPAGIRKTGPWVVCLSGIIAPAVTLNGFFIDRQSNLSIFNKKTGLVISGANSKRQPELASFTEVTGTDSIHMPVSSVLDMKGKTDKLAVAYNTFFAILEIPRPTKTELSFKITSTYKWGDAVSGMTLQLVLIPGEVLETGKGKKITVGEERFDWGDEELGGLIKHHGWTLHIPRGMRFSWPVYTFNPYKDDTDNDLQQAIATLSVHLQPKNQEFLFKLEVD